MYQVLDKEVEDVAEWGRLLTRFRDGTVTAAEIRFLNDVCILRSGTQIPHHIQYAVYYNCDRDLINTRAFEKHCEETADSSGLAIDATLIFSDDLHVKHANDVYSPLRSRQYFWKNCGEADIDTSGTYDGQMDPVLKLFQNGKVMMTHNESVECGQANGTCAEVLQILLKHGEQCSYIMLDSGVQVPAVLAGQVDRLVLQHTNEDISPRVFELKSSEFSFKTRLPVPNGQLESPITGLIPFVHCVPA